MVLRRHGLAQRRRAVGFSQESLAERLGVDRSTVTRWERGETEPLPWLRPRLARVLRVSLERLDDLLTGASLPEVASDEQPRCAAEPPRDADPAAVAEAGRHALVSGAEAAIRRSPDGVPVMSLLKPGGADELPRHVTREHIDHVEAVTGVFDRWDNAHGGSVVREVADDALRRQARLLTLTCPDALRGDLHTAMAQLAGVVAFMLFDACEHDAARCRFTFALQCCDVGGDWHQRAMLLSCLARQAIWCGHPDDGLTCIEMGLVRSDRLTATERAMMHTVRSRALAKRGSECAQDALAAVGAADEAFADSRPTDDPPWMHFYDDAQHHGDTAHALFDVAVHTALRTEADSRFRYSVEHHEPEFARSRAISRTKLASLTMVRGDPREAAEIGHAALDDAGAICSRRTVGDLSELLRLAAPHDRIPEVAGLLTRIGTAIRTMP